jgi:ATP synthase protein I
MGIVGWSVAVPVLLGILAGIYLDEQTSVGFSWTLTGLLIGVLVGCLNAWFWISRNQREIQSRREDDRDES